MPIRTVRICNEHGLHARPATQFVTTASKFAAEVFVAKAVDHDGASPFEANGKSILGVLLLQAEAGSELVIRTEGADAEEALGALAALVESGFGES